MSPCRLWYVGEMDKPSEANDVVAGTSTNHPATNHPVTNNSAIRPSDETRLAGSQVAEAFAGRPLTTEDLTSPPPRRVMLPAVLFVVTCLSTFWAGASLWTGWGGGTEGSMLSYPNHLRWMVVAHWQEGFIYMVAVLAILLAHEMGHFVATLYYRIPASLPFFIPFPISPIGTMGAVIGMAGSRADRKQIFDIGIAGPLAGLVLAIPMLVYGVKQIDFSVPVRGPLAFDCPLLMRWFVAWFHPDYAGHTQIAGSQLNPLIMASWVGLLITGLNMMPISQLDGGHVTYALFRRRAHAVARGFLLFAVVFVVVFAPHWAIMVVLVALIGTDHPPTANDRVPLGWFRTALGVVSLAIPILCFPPQALIAM